jgi:hypothetical protein
VSILLIENVMMFYVRNVIVSFIGCILLTKSLLCNVVVLTRMPYYSESSKYLEFMSLIRKKPYYDKFQCHKFQEGYFRSSRKILCRFQFSKSRILCFRPDDLVKLPDSHQC